MPNTWRKGHTLVLLVLVGGIVTVGLLIPSLTELGDDEPNHVTLWTWLLIAFMLALFVVVAGHGVNKLWRGALVDERNRVSLSRLQMTLWTILIVSGYLAAALANIGSGQDDPLAIAIPTELWAALGISAATLVGSPLALNARRDPSHSGTVPTDERALMSARGIAPADVSAPGGIVEYKSPADSRWSDLFTGERAEDAGHLDLSRVQMFFFTIVLVLAYAVAMADVFNDATDTIDKFPDLDPAFIALLGISHAGYLTKKAIPLKTTG